MNDQTIKDEVLEAESVIRGLAQRMREADAAVRTAESARLGMTQAGEAMLASSAQMEQLSKKTQEAIDRAEQATQDLVRHSHESLTEVATSMSREAESLREVRTELGAAAAMASAAATAANEKAGTSTAVLESLCAHLPIQVSEALDRVAASISTEIGNARTASETLHAHLEFAKNEMQVGMEHYDKMLNELRGELQKIFATVELVNATLQARLQESRVKAASQMTTIESNLMARAEATDTKVTWMLVFQIAVLIATIASVVISAKVMMR